MKRFLGAQVRGSRETFINWLLLPNPDPTQTDWVRSVYPCPEPLHSCNCHPDVTKRADAKSGLTMSLSVLSGLRRFPAFKIKRSSRKFGPLASKAYRIIDRRGGLSDFMADPRTTLMGCVPRRLVRKWLSRESGPLVSVIVATRNNADTIVESLHTLVEQTHRNLEIIVIDDASEDHSLNLIRSVAKQDRRIRVVHNEQNLGTGRSRNVGLKLATGDFVTFHDGDDFSLPTRIAAQLAVFSKFQGKTLSLCNYVRVDDRGRRLEINDRRVMKCIISMMFPRKEVLERVGYFSDSSISEDSDFYQRIKIEFGPACEVLVFRTLYEALFRPNSSFFSDVTVETIEGQAVKFSRSEQSLNALAELKARHALMREGRLPVFVGFEETVRTDAGGTR